jgi:hypothetical protein
MARSRAGGGRPRKSLRVNDAAKLRLFAAVAVLLVLVRSYAMVAYEQLDFDSDQAIVGLMAKHLSELRTFPLFFYGQDYMLGVQSWIAAPFFRLGGPTLAMLRLPLVIINCIVAVWLLRQLARSIASPWLAFAAILPFASSTPIFSVQLVETLGASVEPFLYVLILWALRRRPVAFGVVFAVGFLHREFTAFALLATAVATWWETGRSNLFRAGWLLEAGGGFLAVWVVVDQLKRRINLFGPAGGAFAAAPLSLQLHSLLSRLVFRSASMMPKLRQVLLEALPDLLGMRPVQPLRYGMNASIVVGSWIIGAALLAVVVLCVVRLAALWKSGGTAAMTSLSPFCMYIALIAAQAIFAYSLSDAVSPDAAPILRYAFLTIFAPIALVTALFELDRTRRFRTGAAVLLYMVGALSAADNLRIIGEYRSAPPPNEHRILADDLVAHHIRYGTAVYWDAYVTDFLSRERVILASTDKVRITAYQAKVQSATMHVEVLRQPCTGRQVASWCIVDAGGR